MADRTSFAVVPAEFVRERGDAQVEFICHDDSEFPVNVYRTLPGALRYARSMVRYGPAPAWVLRVPTELFAHLANQWGSEQALPEIPLTSVGAGAFKRVTKAQGVKLLKAAEA